MFGRERIHTRQPSLSDKFRKEKSVSRSSSGIGTASRGSGAPRKISSDDTSSRCFSPSLKNSIINEISDDDVDDKGFEINEDEKPRKGSKMRQMLSDNKFGSLKNLKKALSKKKLFKKKNSDETENFEQLHDIDESSPKTPVLGNTRSRKMVLEDDYGSFTEEEETYSMSDYEAEENKNYQENYREFHPPGRSKSHGNVSRSNESPDAKRSSRRHKSGSDSTKYGKYQVQSMNFKFINL